MTAKIVTALVALTFAATSCFGGRGVGSALKAGAPAGSAQVLRPGDSAWQRLEEGDRVAPGSQVRTAAASFVALQRDDGASIELGPSSDVRLESVTRVGLTSGRVLAAVRQNTLSVVSEGVLAAASRAIFRVDSGFAVRVGSYGGAVSVVQDAQHVTVGDFGQVEIAAGVFPRQSIPLRISASDPWDQKILADALALDGELRKYGRVFKTDFASRYRDPAFYLGLAPGLSAAAVAASLRAIGDPADMLFAVLMARRAGGAPVAALGSLIDLRLAGATWGLIAKEKGISMKEFLAMVIAALGPAQPGQGTGGGKGTGGSGGNGGGSGGSSSPSPRPSSSKSASPSPSGSGSPSPSQSPSPSPSPCSAIDQILGRCTSGGLLR